MRLVSLSQEASLLKKVRAAYGKMTKAVLSADLLEVVYAAGLISGANPLDQKSTPPLSRVRHLIKSGSVLVDRETVEHADARLNDAAKSIRDKLVSRIKIAISDGSSILRRQKNVGRQQISKVRKAAVERVHQVVEKALQEAQRDWKLAVDFAAHDLLEEAKASTIVKSMGHDPLVFKKCHTDCCDFCRLLYTVDGTTPRIFNLSELVDNGTNIGRKAGRPVMKGLNATEWLPVLGPLHLQCKCELQQLPSGASFGPGGMLQKEDADGRRAV